MITQEQIEIARKHFERAAREFGFTFISPYCLDEAAGISVFGYMPEYGSPEGAAFSIISLFDEDREIRSWLKQNRSTLFHSLIDIEPLLGEYDPAYFKELRDDWYIDPALR